MARTVVPIQQGARNNIYLIGSLAAPLLGGTAIDQANGMYVAPKKFHRLAILIYNSKVSAILTTVRAAYGGGTLGTGLAYPPAESGGQGDLAVSIATVSFGLVTGLDGARFAQSAASGGSGQLYIDWDSGATGTVWAYELGA